MSIKDSVCHNRHVPPRFYAPGADAGRTTALPDEEAEHLTRVLRLKMGDAVRVFNGQGQEFDATVAKATKGDVLLAVGTAQAPSAAEARVAITLAQAVLKGDKMDDVVRDAVMMGVTAIQPLLTARTEVSLAVLQRGNRRERWQRIAVSSAKQCGRAVVPEILAPLALVAAPGTSPGIMLVEPGAAPDAMALSDLDLITPSETTLFVGPEGGWTPEEIASLSITSRLVTLRAPTLRADAAALVALAALFAVWKQL
jgi:16S rRNA (uracil1498-N3)-methyltransferase